jgi:hypothetical protein
MINSKGVPFFVEFGANKVASIDPATMVIREWTLPMPPHARGASRSTRRTTCGTPITPRDFSASSTRRRRK